MGSRHWQNSYPEGISANIDEGKTVSVINMIDEAINKFSDRPAFSAFGTDVTFAEIDRLSDALAAYLQNELQVTKGDRVAVMTPNIFAFPVSFFALMRIGAVQVNVNPLYTPKELEHQLNDAGVEAIIIFSASTQTLADVIQSTSVKHVIVADALNCTSKKSDSTMGDPRLHNALDLDEVIAAGSTLSLDRIDTNGSDPIFLQYTGGTTGLSKGAILSNANLIANVLQFKAVMQNDMQEGDECIVTALPLYHIFALMVNLITYFSLGAKNILIANPRDMDGFVAAIRDAKLTAFTGVNTLYAGLTAHPEFATIDWSQLRLAMGGGAPIFASTSSNWEAVTGKNILEGYGLSETSPILTINFPGQTRFSSTVGLPVPSTDIVLLDENDSAAPIGERGEICARGPQVMSGYWNREDANAEVFTSDGYFRTGDIGVFDEDGFLSIVDRKKDMILVSGFNVFPNEIEAVVSELDDVNEVACVGIDREKTGEAVFLAVSARAGSGLNEDDIKQHCRSRLAGYKVPRTVKFYEELPKSTVGKILRREIRASLMSAR